jgi:hypothetical protein
MEAAAAAIVAAAVATAVAAAAAALPMLRRLQLKQSRVESVSAPGVPTRGVDDCDEMREK